MPSVHLPHVLPIHRCFRIEQPLHPHIKFLHEYSLLTGLLDQIGFGSNKRTRHMMPSGHKAFVVNNPADVDLLLMHNKTYAAE